MFSSLFLSKSKTTSWLICVVVVFVDTHAIEAGDEDPVALSHDGTNGASFAGFDMHLVAAEVEPLGKWRHEHLFLGLRVDRIVLARRLRRHYANLCCNHAHVFVCVCHVYMYLFIRTNRKRGKKKLMLLRDVHNRRFKCTTINSPSFS